MANAGDAQSAVQEARAPLPRNAWRWIVAIALALFISAVIYAGWLRPPSCGGKSSAEWKRLCMTPTSAGSSPALELSKWGRQAIPIYVDWIHPPSEISRWYREWRLRHVLMPGAVNSWWAKCLPRSGMIGEAENTGIQLQALTELHKLAKLDPPGALRGLIKALDPRQSDNVITLAAQGIRDLGPAGADAVPALIAASRRSTWDWHVRQSAIEALAAQTPNPKIKMAVRERFADSNLWVRIAACKAIWGIDHSLPEITPALKYCLIHGADVQRLDAAEFIVSLAEAGVDARPLADLAFHDSSLAVKAIGAKALWKLSGDPAPYISVSKTRIANDDENAQWFSLNAMMDLARSRPDALGAVISGLKSKSWRARAHAADLLGS